MDYNMHAMLLVSCKDPRMDVVMLHTCAGVTGYPAGSAYAASKHAVVGMMRCAAAEYGPLGLRVNCINPGAVGEHMTSSQGCQGWAHMRLSALESGLMHDSCGDSRRGSQTKGCAPT
jgi:NAD(P)-dependent dehydrogenase (short-subunit alcohol dehydrogenase family)